MERQEQTDIKVFICYAREDMAIAKKLYKDLQRAGIKPWLDIEDLQPGQKWEVVIADVLKQSDFVLVLLSSYSLNKTGYFRKDLNNALKLMDMVPPDKSFLIPVRLEECEPKEEELQQIQWCDLFESYEKGVNQILKVMYPDGIWIHLRSEPLVVSEEEFGEVFHLDGHDHPREYIRNAYKDQGEVIVDQTTGLMWQKSGSPEELGYADAQKYVEVLNRQKFADHDDWRLPTIPELMSLIEPDRQLNEFFINPMFDLKQGWCWSADRRSSGAAWLVNFYGGYVLALLPPQERRALRAFQLKRCVVSNRPIMGYSFFC